MVPSQILFIVGLALALAVAPLARAVEPVWDGLDAKRERIVVQLQEWVTGLKEPTDLLAVPGKEKRFFVLEKGGALSWFDHLTPNKRTKVLQLPVRTSSELGLLGIALHPEFAKNRHFFLNYNPEQGARRTRVSRWTLASDWTRATDEKVVLEFEQPYPNHNGGQLVFGPDGMLYIGTGDGGFAGDPKNRAQDPSSLLGKMLRIQVDSVSTAKPYSIPKDNPFVSNKRFRPEIWAWGLRNPWRFSFGRDGRLIAADVGQNHWEEVSVVEAGENYGWRIMEASQCYSPAKGCPQQGLRMPWLEYSREDGASITGGFVYEGSGVSALKGKYVFGDFVSGRLWAADLPAKRAASQTTRVFAALGRFPITLSTFARDHTGELIVADFTKGSLYRIVAGGS